MTIKLTREEAIQDLKAIKSFERYARGRLALDIAIEALKREPSEDGTLEIKVEDATKVGRVLISDDKHRGGLYYPDEDEPQGVSFENDTEIKSYSKDSDLISRADAIRVVEKNSYRMAGLTEVKLKCEIEAVPSAEAVPQSEQYKKGFEDAKRAFLVEYARESENMRKRNAELEVRLNAQKAISADRPKGEWTTDEVAELLANTFGDECACNWSRNDEWLPEVCKYAETTCPSPKEINGCWKQFLIQGGAEWVRR